MLVFHAEKEVLNKWVFLSINNHWEAMLLQAVTNYTEFKFPNFKRKDTLSY